MVKWIRFYGMIAALVFAFGGANVGKAQTSDLVGMLTSQLGVSQQQASGGAGSLLSFAKDQMSAGDFDVVSSELPDVDSLIGAAPDTGSSALGALGALSSGSSLLGGSSGGLGDMAGVASTFSDLGLSPDMVTQFVPVILEYAQTSGSEQAMQLLQGALTGL
jgi:hypothetical protein